MSFTLLRAQGDGIGAGGSVEVWIERVNDSTDGTSPLVRIEVEGAGDEAAHTGEKYLTLPVSLVEAFLVALPKAVEEARRTGILPK
jgi:hypothetical protein